VVVGAGWGFLSPAVIGAFLAVAGIAVAVVAFVTARTRPVVA